MQEGAIARSRAPLLVMSIRSAVIGHTACCGSQVCGAQLRAPAHTPTKILCATAKQRWRRHRSNGPGTKLVLRLARRSRLLSATLSIAPGQPAMSTTTSCAMAPRRWQERHGNGPATRHVSQQRREWLQWSIASVRRHAAVKGRQTCSDHALCHAGSIAKAPEHRHLVVVLYAASAKPQVWQAVEEHL